MPQENSEIARIFGTIADLLEIEGANTFRVRAYRNASHTIEGLSENVADLVRQGKDLSDLPGIGHDLAKKIITLVNDDSLPFFEQLKRRVPLELTEVMHLSGLGGKRVHTLYRQLNIESLSDLEAAARAGQIQNLPGFGAKTEEKILAELQRQASSERRYKLNTAEEAVESLLGYLKETSDVTRAVAAGSFRRRQETVGDIDVLVTCTDPVPVMERFVRYDNVDRVVSHGDTRSTVVLRTGLQVDLRVVDEDCYGAALHYFTGSKAHNIAVRRRGIQASLKINEYGVFRGQRRIAGRTEREVYQTVDLPYIEPELREDRGEIEAAEAHQLPSLIELGDMRGDLHVHTRYSDGRYSLKEMAGAAAAQGYEYVAITDHSQRLTVARGLTAQRLREQIKEIDELNQKLHDFVVLKGIEVDILEDGRLDLPDDVLAELDLVIASVHGKFDLAPKAQTERILRALDNHHVNILGHPTGRLLIERAPYQVDLHQVMEAARDRGCIMELNAHPDRLDLSDHHCHMAKDVGVLIAISTDAHHIGNLDYMKYGIGQARRGWLEATDVINTRPLAQLRPILERP